MVLNERTSTRNVRVVLGVFSALWMNSCMGHRRLDPDIIDLKNAAYQSALRVPAGKTEKISVPRDAIPLRFDRPLEKIGVSDLDSLSLALSSRNPNTAIVNAANAEIPGGGFRGNGFVQEEALCTVTNLYPSLEVVEKTCYPLRGVGQARGLLWTQNVRSMIGMPNSASRELLSTRLVNQFKKNQSEESKPSVFLSPELIQSNLPLHVFSMAAPNRSKVPANFDGKRFFWDMLQHYKVLLETFNAHSLNSSDQQGVLIFTIPGSGVFARKQDKSVDHIYLDLNVCALSSSLLLVQPCFATIIPHSTIDGRNLGQEILAYVEDPSLLVNRLLSYQIPSSLNQAPSAAEAPRYILAPGNQPVAAAAALPVQRQPVVAAASAAVPVRYQPVAAASAAVPVQRQPVAAASAAVPVQYQPVAAASAAVPVRRQPVAAASAAVSEEDLLEIKIKGLISHYSQLSLSFPKDPGYAEKLAEALQLQEEFQSLTLEEKSQSGHVAGRRQG